MIEFWLADRLLILIKNQSKLKNKVVHAKLNKIIINLQNNGFLVIKLGIVAQKKFLK